jgi:predicted negative regulator of RcsB-dependent stress response
MDLGDIIQWVTIVGLVIGAIAGWRKLRPEVQVLDADAATKYSDLVDKAAERESKYQMRIDALVIRVTQLEARQMELAEQVKDANRRADKFEGWAKRLTYQVQSLGGVPVPLEPVSK